MKVDQLIKTPHGIGPVVCWEVFPPLHYIPSGTRQELYADILYKDPMEGEGVPEGSFVRVGVKNVHPTLSLAYYTLNEIETI